MKKIILGLGVAVLALTGCGKEKTVEPETPNDPEVAVKTLECKFVETAEDMEASQTFYVNFRDEKLANIDFVSTFKVSDELKEYISEMKDSVEEEFKNEFASSKVETTTTDDTITIKVAMDRDDLETEEGFVDFDGSFEEVKAAFEEEGYTCK